MASLYEISAEYAELLEAYNRAETEEEAAEVLQSLVDVHGAMEEKAEAYIRVIKNVQSDVDGYKAEAKRLTAKARAGENLIERLKNAMLDAMQTTGTKQIATSIGRWATQMNPVSCEVVDVDRVPMEYHIRQEDKIDRKGLIEHYKATGEIIDGVEFKQEMGVRFR